MGLFDARFNFLGLTDERSNNLGALDFGSARKLLIGSEISDSSKTFGSMYSPSPSLRIKLNYIL